MRSAASSFCGVGLGPAFVDPHFAGPDDPVDVGLGHTLEFAQQEVVQALPGGAFVHRDPAHGWCRGRGLRGVGRHLAYPYNPFHHVAAVSI